MSNVFVIADLHFGHTNCAKWRGFDSAEEQDELIIANWNSIVSKRDVTWVLGDVAMPVHAVYKVARLNGIKHLVLGNHDHHNMHKYTGLFNKIRSISVWKKRAVLSHIPIHPAQFGRWDVPNIHGHLHNGHFINDIRYINVNAEVIGYTPANMKDLLGDITH